MGFSLSDLDPTKVIKKTAKEIKRAAKRAEAEAKRAAKKAEKAIRVLRDQTKAELDRTVDRIDHMTGINLKPIVKTVLGPAHILIKIAEGDNLSEATNDWVANHVDATSELTSFLGSDIEKLATTIVAYGDIPLLLITNLAGDTVEVVEGDEEIEDLIGVPIATLIKAAHTRYDPHAKHLPLELKMVLSHVVDREILKRARYVVDSHPSNVAGLANALSHADNHAVTVDDIIIFDKPPLENLGGYLHWVHELKHVEQFAKRGILEFSADYTKNYKKVEHEAVAAALAAEPVLEGLIEDFSNT